jgi:hypothetical protein
MKRNLKQWWSSIPPMPTKQSAANLGENQVFLEIVLLFPIGFKDKLYSVVATFLYFWSDQHKKRVMTIPHMALRLWCFKLWLISYLANSNSFFSLSLTLIGLTKHKERPWPVRLEIQVLPWDGHINVSGLNQWMLIHFITTDYQIGRLQSKDVCNVVRNGSDSVINIII